jgi:pyruvate dehydrogenase E2 component (dihydrolipoamide acetyltransferase)
MHAANEVIMPVLGMNQDTGKIIRWLVPEGQPVTKGEPLLEVETDKAVAEIEAPATGILGRVTARAGEEVPVGQLIATILPAGQATSQSPAPTAETLPARISPLAARIAADHHVDPGLIQPRTGGRVRKADVLAYLQDQAEPIHSRPSAPAKAHRTLASPKARRLAAESGLDLAAIAGSGPEGAVLAADVVACASKAPGPAVLSTKTSAPPTVPAPESESPANEVTPSATWRIMAERTTAAWREAPHFFLFREVEATRLMAWREFVQKTASVKVTYTDLFVKAAAAALRKHPRINAAYLDGKIHLWPEINIGVAVALDDGLVVPVIRKANELGVAEIAAARLRLAEKARAGRLRPEDLAGGTFTVSNLGMYGVDAFVAVLNPPQSAILAVGRIVERVVPVGGQPAVRPVLTLSLSFDHRSVDGAHGAQFLDTLARFIEEPLGLVS